MSLFEALFGSLSSWLAIFEPESLWAHDTSDFCLCDNWEEGQLGSLGVDNGWTKGGLEKRGEHGL